MYKQLLPILILTLGIGVSVLLIQDSTALKSKAYELIDFVPSFHASENDPNYKNNLDVYKDGFINAFDVIRDRYLKESTKSATSSAASGSAQILKSPEPSLSASPSATPKTPPTPSPMGATGADEYRRLMNLNSTQSQQSTYRY